MKIKFLTNIPLPWIKGRREYIHEGDIYKVDKTETINKKFLYYFTIKDGVKAIFPPFYVNRESRNNQRGRR